jgi:hypothetical protein
MPLYPATTPWIALVACDTNGTSFSLRDDIFTLARDDGAVAAVGLPIVFAMLHNADSERFQLLFSLYSKACIINPAYSDPDNFDQVFDIFSTQSLTSSQYVSLHIHRR